MLVRGAAAFLETLSCKLRYFICEKLIQSVYPPSAGACYSKEMVDSKRSPAAWSPCRLLPSNWQIRVSVLNVSLCQAVYKMSLVCLLIGLDQGRPHAFFLLFFQASFWLFLAIHADQYASICFLDYCCVSTPFLYAISSPPIIFYSYRPLLYEISAFSKAFKLR